MKAKGNLKKIITITLVILFIITMIPVIGIILYSYGVFDKKPAVTVKPNNTYSQTLHVATDWDYKPFSYIDNDEYAGLDVELIAEVANRLEMNLELSLMDWNDAQEGLLDGTFDIILNMESNAILRDDKLIGTIPTDEKQYVVYGKKAVSHVGELYGTRVAAYNRFDELGMNVITGYSYQEMFEKLLKDELDYVICPIQIGVYFVENLNAQKIIVPSYQVSYMYGCMALKAEDTDLCMQLNDVIKELQVEGFIEKLDNKWVISHYGINSIQDLLDKNPAIMISLLIGLQVIILGGVLLAFISVHSQKQKAYAIELQKNIDIINKQNEDLKVANEKARAASVAKSNFLSNMSHDMRTPMNGIIGMTEIATTHIDDRNRVMDCLHKIKNSGRYLLGLINDVLDMAKIENGKMTLNVEEVSLQETMDTISGITRAQVMERSQHFDAFTGEIVCDRVQCDSLRLNQILLNLLSNAIKYTPQEGSIQIRLWQEPSSKGDDYVLTHFIVKDSGIGMSPEFISSIFDTFSREDAKRVQKAQGTGLGMAITKSIVDAMDGTIEVESEPDKGSTFHVKLDLLRGKAADRNKQGSLAAGVVPAETEGSDQLSAEGSDQLSAVGSGQLSAEGSGQTLDMSAAPASVQNKTEEQSLKGMHILLAEDNDLNAEIAMMILEEKGAVAERAEDGLKAVELFESSSPGFYSAILMDLRMPHMNGLEAASAIRAMEREDAGSVPIIALTADAFAEDEQKCLDAGMNVHLTKPIDVEKLTKTLLQFM